MFGQYLITCNILKFDDLLVCIPINTLTLTLTDNCKADYTSPHPSNFGWIPLPWGFAHCRARPCDDLISRNLTFSHPNYRVEPIAGPRPSWQLVVTREEGWVSQSRYLSCCKRLRPRATISTYPHNIEQIRDSLICRIRIRDMTLR